MKHSMKMERLITVGQVLKNRPLSRDTYLMTLWEPETAALAEAGQCVKLRSWPAPEDGGGPLLDRPFSIHQVGDGGLLSVLYRVVGPGTAMLSRAAGGDEVKLSGPFGHSLPAALGKKPKKIYLAAGGIGLAPMRLAAESLGVPFTLFYGERDGAAQVSESWLKSWAGDELKAMTETGDGYGGHGLVTSPLEEALKKEPRPVFACGPAPMLAAVSALGEKYGAKIFVSVEARMACAFGVCLTCSLPLKSGGRFRACQEGPVLDGSIIDWSGVR